MSARRRASTTPEPVQSKLALALLEVGNLAPSLLVADRCAKASGVTIAGIESADSAGQCIKLLGSPGDVREAGEMGLALARQMGTTAELVIMPGPVPDTLKLATAPPVFN